jgi:hypothetical protein
MFPNLMNSHCLVLECELAIQEIVEIFYILRRFMGLISLGCPKRFQFGPGVSTSQGALAPSSW